MKRTENGTPVEGNAARFNAADLTAKLSGVSLTTVTKVIAALDAISTTHNIMPRALLDFERTPLTLPNSERSIQTERAFEHVVRERSRLSDDHWETLKPGRNAA